MTQRRPSLGAFLARAAVGARVLLAAGGGYAVAALATALLSLTLPLARAEAVTAATLGSIAVMAGVVIFVFATRSLMRACVGVGGTGAVLGALLYAVGGPAAFGLAS